MNKLMLTGLVVGALALLSACSGGDKAATASKGKETAIEHAKKHLNPKYVCPMHPQIIRDNPGNCPICGMDLVEKKQGPAKKKGKRKIKYWVAPMDPNYRRDKPGKSPMGMDLVPVYEDGDAEQGVVRISPTVVNNMGVRTAKAEYGRLWRKIDTVGYINFDETKISHIHMRTKGWIQQLHVKSEGERVKKGQLLFALYSPDLVNAQEEYLQALRSGNRGLIRASRDRLVSLGISNKQINRLRSTRKVGQLVRIYAPQDGIIASLKVRQGMYVTPMMRVMSLADLSSVWVLAEVFESQSDWVRLNQTAEVKLPYRPGKTWEGKVAYIYPSLNPKTRTLRVRLRFDNPYERLKPNMYANIVIYGGAKKNVIYIPSAALIRTGRETRVILALGKGRFRARKVTAGMESGGYVQIVRGLRVGERVVTSGQFLIDSESSLKASLARMTGGDEKPKAMKAAKGKVGMKMIMGTGVVRHVLKDGRIKLTHDPIKALGWPSMTMNFNVVKGVQVKGLKPGDKVEFHLKKGKSGYDISAISKTR